MRFWLIKYFDRFWPIAFLFVFILATFGAVAANVEKTEEVRVVFTDQGGELINKALGLTWTHALIQFDGDAFYYEATWPRVCRSKDLKGHSHKVFTLKATTAEVAKMKAYAKERIGVPYNFWGYFFPVFYGQTRGIYCSQYVNDILRAGGVPLTFGAGHCPDSLLEQLGEIYE